jgi:hypothetical protein
MKKTLFVASLVVISLLAAARFGGPRGEKRPSRWEELPSRTYSFRPTAWAYFEINGGLILRYKIRATLPVDIVIVRGAFDEDRYKAWLKGEKRPDEIALCGSSSVLMSTVECTLPKGKSLVLVHDSRPLQEIEEALLSGKAFTSNDPRLKINEITLETAIKRDN